MKNNSSSSARSWARALRARGLPTQMTAQQIVDHMRDTAAKTDSAHLVVSISGQVNGQAAAASFGTDELKDMKGDITLEISYQKPNMLRAGAGEQPAGPGGRHAGARRPEPLGL